MDDTTIVELYLCRDETAIKETAEKYGARLRSLAYGMVGDRQCAEEVENDTYMESWNSIPPHEPRDYLYAFLARITRHLSLNRCRERSALKRSAHVCELSLELEECIPAPDDTECRIDGIVLGEAINAFLGTQNEGYRNYFIRRYWFLDSVSDIAKRYGVSESKVKTALFRCRAGLREYLEKEGYTL